VLHESTSSAANIAAIAALKVQSTDDDFDNPPESEPNKTPTNPQTDPTKTPNTQSGAIKVTQPSTHDKVSTHLRSNSITLSPGSFNSGHSATNNTQNTRPNLAEANTGTSFASTASNNNNNSTTANPAAKEPSPL